MAAFNSGQFNKKNTATFQLEGKPPDSSNPNPKCIQKSISAGHVECRPALTLQASPKEIHGGTNLQQVLGPAFLISFPIWKMKNVNTPSRVAISKHHLKRIESGQNIMRCVQMCSHNLY